MKLIGLLFTSVICAVMVRAADRRPNIILIMADDLGYSDVGCYGGEIDTPHIDRLAKEGVRFRNFYNNAKCSTSRASLMSGRFPERQGGNEWTLITDQNYTLPQALKKAGYRTILSGKWHMGWSKGFHPLDRGFDEVYGVLSGWCSYFNPRQPGAEMHYMHNNQNITEFPEDFYTTDAFTDHALSEMQKAIDTKQPYFLHLTYTAPHWPLHAKPEDIAKYRGRYSQGWEVLRKERYRRMIEQGVIDASVKLPPLNSDTKPWTGGEELQQLMEVHAAMVDRMDQNIGRLLKLLDETGTAENTIVIFLSDNGATFEMHKKDFVPGAEIGSAGSYRAHGPSWANALNAPFRMYKMTGHEGGIATPCVVRWPAQVSPGRWTDSVGHLIDLHPTLMHVAGLDPVADIPEGKLPLHGENLLSVLQGNERKRDRSLFMEWVGNRAMRDGDWKLSYLRRTGRWELYNLAEDRTEIHDVSNAHPELFQKMIKQWEIWANESGFDPERRLPWEKKAKAASKNK